MMKMKWTVIIAGAVLAAGCSDTERTTGTVDGPSVAIDIAPLDLPGIGYACYDLEVTNAGGDTVWSQGTAVAEGAFPSICSDQFGNGDGGGISYIGPCDASEGNETHTITLRVDGLYDANGQDIGDYENPCEWPNGCTQTFDCAENADVFVPFDLTIMRDAQQGFFDVAVNFEDIFCSAKYDTCYDVGTADERPITLLHGADGERDHTGVLGMACAGDPNTAAETVLHHSEMWVWCDGWSAYWVLDPSAGPGNVEVQAAPQTNQDTPCDEACIDTFSTNVQSILHSWKAVDAGAVEASITWCEDHVTADCADDEYLVSQGYLDADHTTEERDEAVLACETDQSGCEAVLAESEGFEACVEACYPTIRYATYWGTEQLDCGGGEGSCNKVYWNVAINLDHLHDQGLRNCHMVTAASASTAGSGTFVDGELAADNAWYPIIDFGHMDGDWDSGLPLVGAEDTACVAEPLNGDGSGVHTDYVSSKPHEGVSDTFYTAMCWDMTQGEAGPVADPDCLEALCLELDRTTGGAIAFCDE